MKKGFVFIALTVCIWACSVATKNASPDKKAPVLHTWEDTLRYWYSQPLHQWPKPSIEPGIDWKEFGPLPSSPLSQQMDSLQAKILLGKTLFFDPRLSGSNKISCATCHLPEKSWTDAIAKSIGHDDQVNKRNAPTILNSWFYKELFWDGRSKSLEDQAFGPINSDSEMHSDMPELMYKLRRIAGYKPLFEAAYGRYEVSPETVTEAIATFERTLVSEKAAFDRFLQGDKLALSSEALRGLHLFRTKAKCMNCHYGPLFTDESYHNLGLSYYKTFKEDLGRYNVTKNPADVGKFRTPSLRDVFFTGPWMHDGSFPSLEMLMNQYNIGMPGASRLSEAQAKDPMYPRKDSLITHLSLSGREMQDIIAFLKSISAPTKEFVKPALPQ